MKKEYLIKGIAETCRLLIGVVFIFSGFVKAVDPMGFAIKITDYLAAFGLQRLEPFALLAAANLIAVEFTLGVCTLLGVYRKYASFFVLLFMGVMTPLTLYLALFDPVSDCGCFGDALVITNWQTFWKNVVLLAAAIFLFMQHKKVFRVFTYKVYWFVALFTYFYAAVFAWWNYNHLPLMDFRPYKVGTNIPAAMQIPEGEEPDEYEYTFIYEKDGVKKEFTINNYPADDTTWTFVDTRSKLLKKGYTPPIESFNFYNGEEEVTDIVLESPNPVLLLIAPKLEDASDERVDEINNMYDYALEHRIDFYCVTGSDDEAIRDWTDITGAEYPFLHADDILLKTIIRSNPGLVLLKEGTILMKWHYNDIPEEEDIEAEINSRLEGNAPEMKRNGWIPFNLLSFTLPLLFVWIYDFFRFRRRKRG